jgi:hypothetical protein
MKTCSKCKIEKSLTEFHIFTKRGYLNSYCKKCANKITKENREKYKEENGVSYSTEWKRNHREEAHKHDKKRYTRIKLALVTAYGGVCTCCGEHRIEFLTLEHINHDGKEHRLRVGGNKNRGGHKIYSDVLKQGCPDNYTILCMNCNFAEKDGNPCPHKKETVDNVLPFTQISNVGEK